MILEEARSCDILFVQVVRRYIVIQGIFSEAKDKEGHYWACFTVFACQHVENDKQRPSGLIWKMAIVIWK